MSHFLATSLSDACWLSSFFCLVSSAEKPQDSTCTDLQEASSARDGLTETKKKSQRFEKRFPCVSRLTSIHKKLPLSLRVLSCYYSFTFFNILPSCVPLPGPAAPPVLPWIRR